MSIEECLPQQTPAEKISCPGGRLTQNKGMYHLKRFFLYVIITLAALLMIMPFIWMISASLKPEIEVFSIPIKWVPSKVMWSNYHEVWIRVPFYKYYINTAIVTVAITGLQILTCSLAAYFFAKLKYPERDALFLGYLGTMMIPFMVIMIPQFIIIRHLGLSDNLMSLILIGAFSPFGVFLFRQFFLTIPEELSEAARIDGCSEFGIYWHIMMPLAKPAMGSLTVLAFVFAWNDFLGPLIYLSSEGSKTLQLGMRNFMTQYSQDYALLMAAAVCAMLPTMIVYLMAQDFFTEGVVSSGLKG